MILENVNSSEDQDLEVIGTGEKRVVFQIGKSVLKIPLSKEHQNENDLEIDADETEYIKNNSPRTLTLQSFDITSVDDIKNLSLSGDTQDSFLMDIVNNKNSIIKYLEDNKEKNINIGGINIQEMRIGPSENQKIRDLYTGEVETGMDLMVNRHLDFPNKNPNNQYLEIHSQMEREVTVGVIGEFIEKKSDSITSEFKEVLTHGLEGLSIELEKVANDRGIIETNDLKKGVLQYYEELCSDSLSSEESEILKGLISGVSEEMKRIHLSHSFTMTTNLGMDVYGNFCLFDKAIPRHQYILPVTWEAFWNNVNPEPSTEVMYEILSKDEAEKIEAENEAKTFIVGENVDTYKDKSKGILNEE